MVSGIIPSQHMEIIRNEYYTEDDWFQIGQITEQGDFYTIEYSEMRPKDASIDTDLLL